MRAWHAACFKENSNGRSKQSKHVVSCCSTDFGPIGKCLCGKCMIYLKFRVWKHDKPLALKKIVMAEVSKHFESSSSTTNNISPLPQCLWPPNLAKWWLTMTGSQPHNPLIRWSSRITWRIKNIVSPLPQGLQLPNLAGCWHVMWSSNP